MPQVQVKHIVSFTSEDPCFTLDNFIAGKGKWLIAKKDMTSALKADLQLERAVNISHIDIANSGTKMFQIEVGRSLWPPNKQFQCLVPTKTLITEKDWRSEKNFSAVHMFNKDNFDPGAKNEKWDIIRITCSNIIHKNKQYGLSFMKIFTTDQIQSKETPSTTNGIATKFDPAKSEFLNKFINLSKKTKMPNSLKKLEASCISSEENSVETNSIRSPVSRGGKLVLAHQDVPNHSMAKESQQTLEILALEFLVSQNLSVENMESLKVSDLRKKFEDHLRKVLTVTEKNIFKKIAMDYCNKRMSEIERKRAQRLKNRSSFLSLSDNNNSENIMCFNLENEENNTKTKIIKGFTFTKFNQSSLSSKKRKSFVDSFDIPTTSQTPQSKAKKIVQSPFIKTPKSSKKKQQLKSPNNLGIWINTTGKDNFLNSPSSKKTSTLRKESVEEINLADDPDIAVLDKDQLTVECPLCTKLFSHQQIESHASKCGSESHSSRSTKKECPLCQNHFNEEMIENHAAQCDGGFISD